MPLWYILLVNVRSEKSVRDALLRQGYEAYVATRKELHIWRRSERRVVERVLISSVVFVHVTEEQRRELLDFPNTRSFLTDPARAKEQGINRNPLAVVSDEEMNVLMQMLADDDADVAFATTDFAVGDYVRILGFDEQHNQAQIVRLPSDPATYVGVRVSFLGCAYMKVSPKQIVKIKKNSHK